MSENNKYAPSFKDTLNLPRTDFPIRPQHKDSDFKLLKRWADEDLYSKTFYAHQGAQKYVLHDGPPYTNGNIHIGHAYNKILKDFVTKYQRMTGKHVPVTPGWDCHGLPIELKVAKENPGLSKVELQQACRKYAKKWLDIQREEFKALGVLMNWAHPYATMDFDYEANIMRSFADFVEKGYIEKKNKTVAWCASCETVLASAEIEYQERKDPSIYVKFPIHQDDKNKLFSDLKDKNISFLVWTTTPWTLPLNRAVLLKPKATYQVIKKDDECLIVGKELADKICNMLEIEKEVVKDVYAEDLLNSKAEHPFDNIFVPVLLESFVSLEDGTACVHCAPGCGPEDYEVGLRNNLEIFSPVGVDGKYQKGIKPQELEGVSVQDAQGWSIKTLMEKGKLIHKTSIRHSYPHCWRCRNGLIFRATSQWFCNLSRHSLKGKAISAIEKDVDFIPDQSRNSLKATVEGRLEWCLSRQRIWGVPIPALLCKKCNYAYLTPNLVARAAEGVLKEGVEFWDKVSVEELVGEDFCCPECKTFDWVKEEDILDVWFDSGISHFAVLLNNPELAFPADMYLEGRDQARGWFQSSLLTSLVLEDQPSMKCITTHGYTVDGKGQKMSKSLGNVVAPSDIIDQMGTDGLRLWAASIDFKDDAIISKELLQNVQEVFRKVRNTCRFLLSNLYDFDIDKDAIEFSDLMLIDKYGLYDLSEFSQDVKEAYDVCKFTTVFHLLTDYCTKNLSAFYLDVTKDRLYVEKADGFERRSAQTALWHILDTLTKLMAPMLSFTAELVSDCYQKDKKDSIHLQTFNDLSSLYKALKISVSEEVFEKYWNNIFKLRSALLKSIENEREKGLIKHPLEAEIKIYSNNKDINETFEFVNKNLANKENTVADMLKDLMVVSGFEIIDNIDDLNNSSIDGVKVKVSRSQGLKCPRCWQYHYKDQNINNLCDRCLKAIG